MVEQHLRNSMSKIKKVLYDIETFPNILTTWDLFPKNMIPIQNILKERSLICAAWKVHGETKVHSICVRPDDVYNDQEVVETLYKVLSDADEIIGHYSDRFDLPMLRTRALRYGLGPLPPVAQTDTYKMARTYFKFNSNKLDYIAGFLGVGRKTKTGYELWQKCALGDKVSLKKMVAYNKNDVRILGNVYETLVSYAPAKLNTNLITDKIVCPSCGSNDVQKRGISYTRAGKKQRYHCQSCGHWSHGPIKMVKDVLR